MDAPSKTSPPTHYPPVTTAITHTPLTSPPAASSASSYPAILVGRPTAENKPKVPPPVPPRGTPKTKRGGGGIAGKGLHPRCFGHERHASAPVAAYEDANVRGSAKSFSSSSSKKKVSTLPTGSGAERLKAELRAGEFGHPGRFRTAVKGKFFKDLFEARNEILGRDYEDMKKERAIYPANVERQVVYDSNVSLHEIGGRVFYKMDDYV